jgi:hypothetical protein
MSQIIIRPIVTEKMTAQGEKEGRYGFEVAQDQQQGADQAGGEKSTTYGNGRSYHDRAAARTAPATPRRNILRGGTRASRRPS